MKSCLAKLKEIGLYPKLVVCDQGSNNVKTFRLLGVSTEKPFFMSDGEKVFCMYDPPHLLKNTRSNMLKYEVRFDATDGKQKHAKWSYLQQFFEYDSALPIRMAPKLTRGHFELTSFSKMRVKTAAQVLSHTVAAGIYTYTSVGKMPAEAAYTAEFVQRIDKLFDSFNCRSFKEKKKIQRPLSKNSEHLQFYNECIPWLKSIYYVGSKTYCASRVGFWA